MTTVPMTLVDIAATSPHFDLAKRMPRSRSAHHTTPGRGIGGTEARRPNTKGAAKLKSILSGETKVSLSRLESRFLSLLRAQTSRSL